MNCQDNHGLGHSWHRNDNMGVFKFIPGDRESGAGRKIAA